MAELYYSDDRIQLYHGRCEDVLPTLAAGSVDLVLTDPPYGVNEKTERHKKGRDHVALSNDFPAVYGDDRPFDPSPLLAFRRVILFGANYYAQHLPPSASWLVWDKLDGLSTNKRAIGFDDNADCELIWTNIGGPARIIRHRWKGMLKGSEKDQRRLHPTQKPVWLMEKLVSLYTKPGDLVLDPYMGSGPVAEACRRLGRRYIGIDVELQYVRAAAGRLAQEVMDLAEVAA